MGLLEGYNSGIGVHELRLILPCQIWEPALERLISGHGQGANYQIEEIWCWESVNHGDACLVNRDNLGGICRSLDSLLPELSY